LQPILLTFILSLAVLTTLFASSMDYILQNETDRAQSERYGSSHLTVTLDGASKSRFMFVKDAEEVLGDAAEVAGSLTLPMMYGEGADAVFGVATDFSEIGRIFDFTFTEYGVLTEAAVSDSAFLSAAFAERHALGIGDAFEIKVFGKEKLYTVAGISPLPFLESYDIMVDNSGIASLLAGDSLLLSAVKDGFRPYSTLYIEILEKEKAENTIWDRLFKKNSHRTELEAAEALAAVIGIPRSEIKIVMVNGRQSALSTLVRDGDRVAYFPAVGGG
jgi:molybdopterin converting factor small subunit